MTDARRTPLYNEHVKLGAKMIDFHGWEMPLQYGRILDEHMAVRTKVGIFDVSHMGDIIVEGSDALPFLLRVLPTDVSKLKSGEAAYTAFLNYDGNIIDDTIIYRLSEDRFFFVPNASMIDTIYKWISSHSHGFNVKLRNVSDDIACIAVQGPQSRRVLERLGFIFPESFKFSYSNDYGKSKNAITDDNSCIVSGTGYTGEQGVELILGNKEAVNLWRSLLGEISDIGGLPCGLGARDTLRMEKGMLLSGTDFNGDRNPYECSISFIVNNDHDFIGKNKLNNKQSREIFRGLILQGKLIPRHGYDIVSEGKKVGTVTSGTMSPIIGSPIALGFINRDYSKPGTEVGVNIRDNIVPARVSKPKMVP
ncbi:MAG TPA: glycine cleavage system aminomethyltransferase GcvT [Thermoplasmataceae archaeon]|nr:glycine cleavage system aminomethyltransferase GcvT [Thermoplasmatales archaeon AK]HLH85639.1 glycine cleavage system aminomethyltransferase GcvT [Thermoplasmataceae archaeon]